MRPEGPSERLRKAEALIVAAAVGSGVDLGSLVEFTGGYAVGQLEGAERRRLLLPLRKDERIGKLREDV